MFTTLSNQLTLARLLAIPAICALLVIDGWVAAWLALLLFVAAAITDYFDGHFARARNERTVIGRILDPIADKLLVAATLLMLVFDGRIGAWTILPALVILLREVAVSGLRKYLAELKVGLPVTRLAKWKTGVQMTAIPFLIARSYPLFWPDTILPVWLVGSLLLWIAATLTVITGYDYWAAARRSMNGASNG